MTFSNLQKFYDQAFQQLAGPLPLNQSLVQMLQQEIVWQPQWRILELGCGSLSLAACAPANYSQWLALDFSEQALSLASKMSYPGPVSFFCTDVSWQPSLPQGPFELVIDAHMFHCLPSLQHFKNSLAWSMRQLASGGLIVAEMMVSGPELELPFDYSWDGECVTQKISGSWCVVRILPTAQELHALIRDTALVNQCRLTYFSVDPEAEIDLCDQRDSSKGIHPARWMVVKN